MKQVNEKKVQKILKVLARSKQKLWIREIARRTKLSPGIVSHYINTALRDKVKISHGKFAFQDITFVELKEGRKNEIFKI